MGDTGPDVVVLQQELNKEGNNLATDGIFGQGTDTAVRNFQRANGLVADGIVGPATWDKLLDDTAQPDKLPFADVYYPLNVGEYISEVVKKYGITLHHTVSAGSPYKVVDGWNKDNRRGVGTHFVVGGIDINGDTTHDGTILQAINIDDWAHHILTTRMGKSDSHNVTTNKRYVGIEICSFGCLQKKGDKFYTMDGTNREVPAEMVEVVTPDWRTYSYWHKYSDKQVDAVMRIITELDKLLSLGLANSKYDKIDTLFELSWDALNFRRVLTSHGSFEDGKFDAYPCDRLIKKLKAEYPKL